MVSHNVVTGVTGPMLYFQFEDLRIFWFVIPGMINDKYVLSVRTLVSLSELFELLIGSVRSSKGTALYRAPR